MLKLMTKQQPKHDSIINKINNKPHKLDYETIKNIVEDNRPTINPRIEPSRKLHIRQWK